MKLLRQTLLAGTIAALVGCGGADIIDPGPTLATVNDVEMPDVRVPVPTITLEEIEQAYRDALTVAEDPGTRRKILIRLAGLEMASRERDLAEATTNVSLFGEAIAMYQELIYLQRQQPEGIASGIDELLYQLSKAYALDGQDEQANQVLAQLANEFPDSKFLAEANFRRAERDFSQENYRISSDYYEAVVAAGPSSEFYENGLYMLGWSQFKRGIYEDALDSFTQLLDVYLDQGQGLDDLSRSDRNLAEDTLRVMSLAFSYLDGPASIRETYVRLGARDYEYLLYQNLAELYLSKERYSDSASAYQQFVDLYPLSPRAPDYSAAIIDVYEMGGFPELLVPAKSQYVSRYGIDSDYWALQDDNGKERLKPRLHIYLTELAKYHHARAQQWQKTKADNPDEKIFVDDRTIDTSDIDAEFLLAANWYRQFVQTFPEDPETGPMNYLLAEALYSAKQVEAAYAEYFKVAFKLREILPDQKVGADAAYTAVLLAKELFVAAGIEDEQVYWQDQAIYTGLLFSDLYGTDPRAPTVLTEAAQSLLNTGQASRAVTAALRVTQWQPQPEKDLLTTAWLIAAQGQFDARKFADAEVSYEAVLDLIPRRDDRRQQLVQRLAASIYQQADEAVSKGDLALAIGHLYRVREKTPNTEIAKTAHFDLGNHLMTLERWDAAREELLSYRKAYPSDPLTASIPAKMVVVYQGLEQWTNAAQELQVVMRSDPDPEVQRQSKLLVAELYERDNDIDNAILHYRDYAHNYPEPFGENIEAQVKMTELYEATRETDKRNFWLRKLMATHDGAASSTDRSTFLAAWAANDLAGQQYQVFQAIRLTLPLKTSLARKKSALEKTLGAYEKALSYDILSVSTEANYRIGEIYAQLSRDLMDSQRPKGLNELELEQYEILLEEQALPFEDQAIDVHVANSERSWGGVYDQWVKESFAALAKLLPGRYNKQEQAIEVADEIY